MTTSYTTKEEKSQPFSCIYYIIKVFLLWSFLLLFVASSDQINLAIAQEDSALLCISLETQSMDLLVFLMTN